MTAKDRLKLENKLLLTQTKAKMINMYLDLLEKVYEIKEDLSYMSTDKYIEKYDIKEEYWMKLYNKLEKILGDNDVLSNNKD